MGSALEGLQSSEEMGKKTTTIKHPSGRGVPEEARREFEEGFWRR